MPLNKIDRRDFMTSSIVAVGASAIVGNEATEAILQANSDTHATGSETAYTGEVIQGKKVVSRLNVAELDSGKKHVLYFLERGGARRPALVCVSVVVAKGMRSGKRFTLTSGVHGDEMSSIRTP